LLEARLRRRLARQLEDERVHLQIDALDGVGREAMFALG
jgi:hypothetical protein